MTAYGPKILHLPECKMRIFPIHDLKIWVDYEGGVEGGGCLVIMHKVKHALCSSFLEK